MAGLDQDGFGLSGLSLGQPHYSQSQQQGGGGGGFQMGQQHNQQQSQMGQNPQLRHNMPQQQQQHLQQQPNQQNRMGGLQQQGMQGLRPQQQQGGQQPSNLHARPQQQQQQPPSGGLLMQHSPYLQQQQQQQPNQQQQQYNSMRGGGPQQQQQHQQQHHQQMFLQQQHNQQPQQQQQQHNLQHQQPSGQQHQQQQQPDLNQLQAQSQQQQQRSMANLGVSMGSTGLGGGLGAGLGNGGSATTGRSMRDALGGAPTGGVLGLGAKSMPRRTLLRPLVKTEKSVYTFSGRPVEIRDVWKENLEQEMAVIRKTVMRYPYIAMDTEFPGVVARPVGSDAAGGGVGGGNKPDYQYQTLRCNVDLLKLIQLGVAFTDEQGNLAEDCPCWQFHFKFSLSNDMYAQDSIDLLVRSGIKFEEHEARGIDVADFGELIMSSGLVLCKEVSWLSFHGGYDFGYLLKLLTCKALPEAQDRFFDLLNTYFPRIYDIKHIMTKAKGNHFNGGLSRLAESLGVERVGPEHQAGSDSMLTAMTYFKMRVDLFDDNMDDVKDTIGVIHGLGTSSARHKTSGYAF